MKPLALAAVVLVLLAGCSKDSGTVDGYAPPPGRDRPTIHSFTWTGFDGREGGNPQNAQYLYDGEMVGTGATGLAEVRVRIATMPTNSEVIIIPPYDPKLRNPQYPFSLNEMAAYAQRFGSVLSLGKPQPPTTQPATR